MRNTLALVTFLTLASSCGTVTTAPLHLTEDGGAAGDVVTTPTMDATPGDVAGDLGAPTDTKDATLVQDAGPELGQLDAGQEAPPPPPPGQCVEHPTMVTPCGGSLGALPCYACYASGARFPVAGVGPCLQGDGLCVASCSTCSGL